MSLIEKVAVVAQAIYERDGYVKPSVLVDEARPVDSPAHDAFEWDDSKAAEEYRLSQARGWLKNVTLVVEDRKEVMVHVPSIVSDSREGYYKPKSSVLRNTDECDRALIELRTNMLAAKKSFEKFYAEAEAVNKRIDVTKAAAGFEMIDDAISQ